MTEEVTQEQQAPALGMADLAFLLNIIDVCTTRGAFKGSELTNVGNVRDKLEAFVKANSKSQDDTEEDATDAEQYD